MLNNNLCKCWTEDKLAKIKVTAILLFGFYILVMGWMCDDAYHGFVMAKHLVEGDGFVYNIGERVNAATNPLWILIISMIYLIIPRMYIVAMLLSVAFSMMAFAIIVVMFCKSRTQILVAMVLACGCSSFVSFTTSGLENCLLFFLFGLAFLIINNTDINYLKKLYAITGILSLIAVTRLDNTLLFMPLYFLFFYYAIKEAKIRAFFSIICFMPLIVWEIFSIVYYGFPFPNTYYVKLNTGIPTFSYICKGIEYLGITCLTDFIVVMLPIFMCIVSFRSSNKVFKSLGCGLLLYFLYIIRIGGDFMVGRHFTVMFYISMCMLFGWVNTLYNNHTRIWNKLCPIIIILVVTTFSLGSLYGPMLLWSEKNPLKVADERKAYIPVTGMAVNTISILMNKEFLVPNASLWANNFESMKQLDEKRGIIPFASGIVVYYHSSLYLQDAYGLGDPLLGHLPSRKVIGDDWRIGHMMRDIPAGYTESVKNNDNEIIDPSLHEYYDKMCLITRGELFSSERLKTIYEMNRGKYDKLIKEYVERNIQ